MRFLLLQSFSQFGRAKLSRILTLWVFGSFMLIEILILFPSYWRREAELEAHLDALYPAVINTTLESFGERQSFQNWPGLTSIQADQQIQGLLLYDPEGQPIDTWGEVTRLDPPALRQLEGLQHQGNSYLVPWVTPSGHTLLLVLDRTPIQQELYGYAGRILGLIALIGAVVTITTMVGIELLVIQPIMRLRRELLAFGQSIRGSEIPQLQPVLTQIPDNELGDVMQTFAQLCDRTITEITERQQAKNTITTLQQQQLALVHTEKMLSLEQLVAGIAHELNNPMAFIKGNIKHVHGYIEDLLGLVDCYQRHIPDDSPDVEAYIQQIDLSFIRSDYAHIFGSIDNGVQRLQVMVNSLRSFARLDEAEQKTVDLHDGLDQSLLLLPHRLGATQCHGPIMIHKDYGTLPPTECYPSQLNQVFWVLLNNAIDAFEAIATAQDCMITLQTRFLESQQKIKILIVDNGCGISKQVQERMFNPFFTTKPVGSGTGLGLAIAYQIIHHNHFGELVLRSEVGVGTECCIELPVQLPQQAGDKS